MGLTNATNAGRKRKSEPGTGPQVVGNSTPTQDVEQPLPLPKKKKMKVSVDPPQPSSTTTAAKRNHNAPLKTRMDGGATKRPIHDEFDEVSVGVNLTHPAKKAKVNKPAVLTGPGVPVPLRRSGKIFLILKDDC